ncbi:MAG: class I SAM-dependent methyltransferase [Cocleimonas sp.]
MTTKPVVAISADRGIPKSQLDKLALQTALALASPNISVDFLLHITTDKLELRKVDNSTKKPNKNPLAISIDFVEGKTQHRRLQGGGKGQDIAKAVGLNKLSDPTVLDLTAGMGGDAFVLASLGATLTMVERNPVVHALLKDALGRAKLKSDAELQGILARLSLIKLSAFDYLHQLNEADYPDIIYLDPMFPSRNKSAQVKKEMQFFHDIVGADEDSESVFLLALNKAKKRIVVKRPRLAEKLTEMVQPSFEITGKSTRYDVYLPIK